MDQNASAALIASIVAVVLAALGLVGGVVGYIQGTAALRRATLLRQRAATAEETAQQARLHADQAKAQADQAKAQAEQAKAQAERAARSAQFALGRLDALGLRSLGDAGGSGTGRIVLPTGPIPSLLPEEPTSAAPAEPPARTGTTPVAPAAIRRPAPMTPPAFGPAPTGTIPTPPARSETPPSIDRPAAASTPSLFAPTPSPFTPASLPPVEPAAPAPVAPAPSLAREEPAPPTGATVLPPATDAPAEAAPAAQAETPAASQEREVPADPVEGEEPAPADEETVPADPVEESEPPAPAARSASGQVMTGEQEAPPMDWAEALRTGAIPLPTVSRRSYSAPARTLQRDTADSTGPARFEVRAVGRQRYEAVNVGATTAEQAAVEGVGDDRHLVRPAETGPTAVRPGAALGFSVLRVEGRRISVQVSWLGAGGAQEQVELPLP